MSKSSQTELKKRFFAAAEKGDAAKVTRLLSEGVDVNVRGPGQSTALEYAASLGHEAVVEILITAGADVNAQDSEYHDALAFAVKGGHAKIVERLLAAGASHTTGLFQYDVLCLAAMFGHTEVVKSLLAAGKRVKTKNGEEALAHAIRGKHEAAAIEIVRAGVRPKSPLIAQQFIEAAGKGLSSLVHEMLMAGVDPDFRDDLGQTALDLAKERGQTVVVEILETNRREATPEKALVEAAGCGDSKKVLALLDEGTDPNGRDANNDTPLCRAVDKRHHDIIQILLDRGAKPDLGRPITAGSSLILGRKTKLQSPLFLALINGDRIATSLLLAQGASLSDLGIQSTATYLVATGTRGQVDLVKWLLDRGLNPSSKLKGVSIKTLASERGDKELMAKLETKNSSPTS